MKKENIKPTIYIVEDRTPVQEMIETGATYPEIAEEHFGTKIRTGEFMTATDDLSLAVRSYPEIAEDVKAYLDEYGVPEIPFIGTSNAGTIMGVGPHKSKFFLQMELLGQVSKTHLPSTQHLFRMGHVYEDPVGNMGARQLRNEGNSIRFSQSQLGMISSEAPHVFGHPDGMMLDPDGNIIALAEVKTAHKDSAYWEEFSTGKVPLAYYYQGQAMMGIIQPTMNVEGIWFLAWNKTGDEDGFVQIYVKHDKELSKKILAEMEKFWQDTKNGILYEDAEILEEEAAMLYKEADKGLGYVELNKHKDTFLALEQLKDEKDRLRAEIAEVEKDIRENEKNQKLLKARLYRDIKNAPGGTCQIDGKVYSIEMKHSFSLNKDVVEQCEKEARDNPAFKEAWEKIKSFSPLVSSRLKIVDAKTGNALTEDI